MSQGDGQRNGLGNILRVGMCAVVIHLISAGGVLAQVSMERQPLAVVNPRFEAGSTQPPSVRDWNFEAVALEYGSRIGEVRRDVRSAGEAVHRVPQDGLGVILEGTTDMARGDLVSAPMKLNRLQRTEVTVEYVLESGTPMVLVCLRPTQDRSLVDLAFLPTDAPGQSRRVTVKLHTGRTKGEYSLAVALVGRGAVRFKQIEAYEAGSYEAPNRPVLVIDLMRPEPLKEGPFGWQTINRLVDVIGFSEIKYLHPLEVTRERLESIDPALIVLSPTSEAMLRADPSTIDIERYLRGVRMAAESGAPVVGICAGHHILAMAYGGRVGAVVEQTADGKTKELSEWGPTELTVIKDDPVFANLPRFPSFRLVEAHSAVVHSSFTMPQNLATSQLCQLQVFRYPGRPWYTFQGHIEADWEYACPEAYLIWKNLLRIWKLES